MSDLNNLNIDILSLPSVVCVCKSEMWLTGQVIKKLSKIQSPNGKEQFIPVPVIFCMNCGKTLEDIENQPLTEENKPSPIIKV